MVIWIIDILLDIALGDMLCGAICLSCRGYIPFIKKIVELHRNYWNIIFPFPSLMRMVSRPLQQLRPTHPWLLLCSMGSLVCLDMASIVIMALLMKTGELGLWIKLWIIITDCLGLLWGFVYGDDDGGGNSRRDDFHGGDAPDEPPSPPEDDGLTPTADAAERWLFGLAEEATPAQ